METATLTINYPTSLGVISAYADVATYLHTMLGIVVGDPIVKHAPRQHAAAPLRSVVTYQVSSQGMRKFTAYSASITGTGVHVQLGW